MNRKEKNGSPSAHPNCLFSLNITQSTTLSFPRQSIKTKKYQQLQLAMYIHQGGKGSLGER